MLNENPVVSSSGQIADHAALKADYDSRGNSTALPAYGAQSSGATHRAIHALLHAEHNQLGLGPHLPSTLREGQGEHLAHHAALHKAYNARQQLVLGTTYRGINLSGAEFAHDAAHLPGTVDRDYRYPTGEDLRYVAGRGHKMVRLPIRWERIQPTLMGPLQPDELRRLIDTITQAAAVGVKVLVDVHNYARYIRPENQGGATLVLGDGQLSDADLINLWSRLSTALKDRAGVLGYGLMNEPHDLPPVASNDAATVARTSVWSFERGAGSWSGEGDTVVATSTASGTVYEGQASLRLIGRLTAGRQYIRANDAAQNTMEPASGRTLTAWVLVPKAAPGTRWSAQLELQDASYRWRPGPSTDLAPGRWAKISCTPDEATWSQHRGVGVQFSTDQSASATVEVYLDNIQQGTAIAALSEAQQWERTSQLCVDAIRANQDVTPVYVPGVAFSGAQNWPQNHPQPWIVDPAAAVVYEAHYYFDRDNSGTYRYSFAEENADALGRGYASLQARATTELDRFLGWCGMHGNKGFIGELGWDNSRNATEWNAVGEALYLAMDAAGVGAAYWAAGQWYGSSYNLSVYTGAPLSQPTAPAGVIELHPSRNI